LLSNQSLADPKATSEAASSADVAPAGAGRSARERAAAAFQASLDAYAAGDLRGALTAMRESYQLSGHTELLYNVARIEDELGACPDALANYRQYIEKVPEGRYRAEAERASLALSARCPSAAIPTHDESVPPAEASPSPPPFNEEARTTEAPLEAEKWWPPAEIGWTAIAVGVAAGAGAIYFTTRAVDARDRFEQSVDRWAAGGPPADFGLQDQQHRAQTAAQVLAVSGGALAVGGLVVLLLAPKQTAQASSRTSLSLAPGHVGADFSLRF
jgi:hypothetical protein